MILFEVAVAVPLQQTLTYSLSESDERRAGGGANDGFTGRRVLVALGRRQVTGYILSSSEGSDADLDFKVKPVIRFLDDFSLFHSGLVTFFRWVADYYQYPIGLVVKAALPGGLSPKSQIQLSLNCDPSRIVEYCKAPQSPWLRELCEKKKLLVPPGDRLISSTKEKNLLKNLVAAGLLKEEPLVNRDLVNAKTEICYALADEHVPGPEEDDSLDDNARGYRERLGAYLHRSVKVSETKALYAAFKTLEDTGGDSASLRDIKSYYPGAAKALDILSGEGVVRKFSKRVFRSPFGEKLRFYPRPETCTADQERVLGQIIPSIDEKKFAPFLLHGVTGCGKTEVYLRSAEAALRIGRDVIILVPEIALATQLEAHLLSRFNDLVVLLHSGLTSSEKYDQYFLALTGKAKIVIGARSAIFAPLIDPGLIIVDEEHDSSYKQDDSFRYHGRDLAVLRARHHSCVVILGSATPSVTSFENGRTGKYTILSMPNRVGSARLPKVTLVDLNGKQDGAEKSAIIQKELLEKLKHTLAEEKQAVLLLNRRGFSTALLCRDCGNPVQCNHCNVSLTLHKSKNRLICHYCGFSASAQSVCVHCRSTNLVPAGFGTERVEEELHQLLPEARIRRLDSDTAADRKKFHVVLSEMHNRSIDILIGTQMIAKGHHFPHVTLVGVVWADGGMSLPDYKAAERTYQLITQVTGRAGRGDFPGEVIIQTLRPDHYAIQYARQHKYLEFFEHEMKLRKYPSFPPYVRLILMRIQGKVEKRVQQSAAQVARFCRKCVKSRKTGVEVLGPAPSPLDKVRDHYRWQILLKGGSPVELHELSAGVRQAEKDLLQPQCSLSVDVDPENMM